MATLIDGARGLNAWIAAEVQPRAELRRGAQGEDVRRVQEWLSLHGGGTIVDGDFGPATERAVRLFQQKQGGLVDSGVVDEATHAELTAPMRRVLSNPLSAPTSLEQAVLAFARQHLAEHPREVGGANRGPWVRLYMEGNEGAPWAWCAGFVSFILAQAVEAVGVSLPIEGSGSCDTLAAQGRRAGLFLSEAEARSSSVPPGCIFLRRRTATDWTHTGIVTDPEPATFGSIEGNTNDDGNRDGYEVCARINSYTRRDFVLLS